MERRSPLNAVFDGHAWEDEWWTWVTRGQRQRRELRPDVDLCDCMAEAIALVVGSLAFAGMSFRWEYFGSFPSFPITYVVHCALELGDRAPSRWSYVNPWFLAKTLFSASREAFQGFVQAWDFPQPLWLGWGEQVRVWIMGVASLVASHLLLERYFHLPKAAAIAAAAIVWYAGVWIYARDRWVEH